MHHARQPIGSMAYIANGYMNDQPIDHLLYEATAAMGIGEQDLQVSHTLLDQAVTRLRVAGVTPTKSRYSFYLDADETPAT